MTFPSTALLWTGLPLFVIAAAAAALAASHSAVAITPKPEGGYVVRLTDGGFVPKELAIPLSETVTFMSERGKEFWPASNIHPTHEIYPEFDPKRALAAEEKWSFTFSREGSFRFHDHLNANITGVIEVVGKDGAKRRAPTGLHDCERIPVGEKQQCWDNLLAYTLRENGFAKAFSLFADLYATEPEVPKACHGWGHALGEAAYALYKEGRSMELRKETAYCGYGFFHGFLEKLVESDGDARGAYQFCRRVAADNPENAVIYANCIHGIGHGGAAGVIERPEMAGAYQKSIDEAIALCQSVVTTARERRDCFDGVYNELVLDMWNSQHGLTRETLLDRSDPLAFCKTQQKDRQASCYFEYMGFFEHLFEKDFAKAARYVVGAIPDPEQRKIAVSKLSADFMQSEIVSNDHAAHLLVCRSLEEEVQSACINGIEIGLIAHGEPDREYEKGFSFCASDRLASDERKTCYERMLWHFRNVYPSDLFQRVCAAVPETYRSSSCVS